jgi:hypothetical protein
MGAVLCACQIRMCEEAEEGLHASPAIHPLRSEVVAMKAFANESSARRSLLCGVLLPQPPPLPCTTATLLLRVRELAATARGSQQQAVQAGRA